MINFQLSTHDRNKTEERGKKKKSQLEINQNEFIAKILQIDCKFYQLEKWQINEEEIYLCGRVFYPL